ncbi:MAG TPA: DUF4124 domain-containing protein [Burkholderiales bacterium]|nr:DUF4124 domain-containing protein [Burkholderiales bacterium]
MKKLLLLLAALAFAGAAAAQQFKWVDKDGRVRYGDTPPPGVKATPLGAPATGRAPAPAPEAAAKDARDAKKGPLTPAEQEAEFRRRQQAATKDAEKQAKADEDARARKQNCVNAQASLRQLESGERVARLNEKGEREFLEDSQRAGEIARARKSVSEWCGG